MPLAEKLSKQQLQVVKKLNEENFEGYFEAGEPRSLIPEGIYKLSYVKNEMNYYHGTAKIYLWFQIIEPYEHKGTELFMAMNALKKVPPGAKYYQQWVIANDNINPERKDRMSPSIFKNGIFKAIVRTVKPRNKNASKYSVIDSLIEKLNCQ
jgi:hypothetical protein